LKPNGSTGEAGAVLSAADFVTATADLLSVGFPLDSKTCAALVCLP